MAAVRLLLGKGAYNIANKKCNNCQRNDAIFGLSALPQSLSGYAQNDQISRAKIINGALSLEVTAVSSLECYLTVNSMTCADQKFVEVYHEVGVDKDKTPFKLYTCGKMTNPTAVTTVVRNGLVTSTQSARCRVFLSKPEMYNFSHPQHSLACHHLFGHEQYVLIRAYSDNGGRSEPLYKSKTGYYDILQVSLNATRTQIKTAYYKQSFIYHPDKNAGREEATIRFSDISEAYNVLGNKGLKKKYDRGLLTLADLVGATKPSARDTASPTKQQTKASQSVVDSDGKKIFDFDAFIKHHYGGQLQRDRELRERKEQTLKMKKSNVSGWKMGKMLEVTVGFILATALAILFNVKRGGN